MLKKDEKDETMLKKLYMKKETNGKQQRVEEKNSLETLKQIQEKKNN